MRRGIIARLIVPVALLCGTSWTLAQVGALRNPRGRVIANQPVIRTDDELLQAAGLSKDDPRGLLAYLRQRTLTDAEQSQIRAIIARLGSDDFEARVSATREAEQFGPAAVKSLKEAAAPPPRGNPDPEVAYRASEILRYLEKAPHDAVAAAVLRTLVKNPPPGTIPVMLAFLPMADTEAVAEEVRTSLTALAYRSGTADPVLLDGVKSKFAVCRVASALALLRGGAATPATQIAIRDAALQDPEPESRFDILFALLMTVQDSAAMEPLLASLGEVSRGRLWQAEDYLLQFAGQAAPNVRFGKSSESVTRARDAWKSWWLAQPRAEEFAKFRPIPRMMGKTLITTTNITFGVTGSVLELGPDLKQRWQLTTLQNPMDAHYTATGRIAVAEHNGARISVRYPDGRMDFARALGANAARPFASNPQLLQVLPNGNFLVTTRSQVVELKQDRDEEVMSFVRNNSYDIFAACRLKDGRTAVLVQSSSEVLFLDEKGQPQEKTLKVGNPNFQACMVETTPGRLLLTEQNRVAEYDVDGGKEAKPVWSRQVSNPRSVQRLPNGNTLVVDGMSGRLVEFAPEGDEVWSFTLPGEQQVLRAYRH
jgi:hypothetical protein